MGYKVTAPYVTLRVKDDIGSDVTKGFYAGGVLPDDANAEDVERLERKGMIAKEGTAEADAAVPVGQPVQFDNAGMPTAAKPEAPKPRAPQQAKPKA